MRWTKDDGGRLAAGFKGTTGDCVVRAVAIATKIPYRTVYDEINERAKTERPRKGRKRSGSRVGVFTNKSWFKLWMRELEWTWVPTMGIGTGCQVHLRPDELPPGRLIVSVSRHICAVIDGVVYDIQDQSRNGTRCVYGYWRQSYGIIWGKNKDG